MRYRLGRECSIREQEGEAKLRTALSRIDCFVSRRPQPVSRPRGSSFDRATSKWSRLCSLGWEVECSVGLPKRPAIVLLGVFRIDIAHRFVKMPQAPMHVRPTMRMPFANIDRLCTRERGGGFLQRRETPLMLRSVVIGHLWAAALITGFNGELLPTSPGRAEPQSGTAG